MRKRLLCIFTLFLFLGLQAQADTWRVFKSKLMYADGKINTVGIFVGAHGKVYSAYRMPGGETLVITGAPVPSTITRTGSTLESKYAKDFEAVGYTPSGNQGMQIAANGTIYMYFTDALFRFDPASEKWTGFNITNGKNTSIMPNLEVKAITGITIDRNNGSLIVAALSKENKPVIAQLSEKGWDTLTVDAHIVKEIKDTQKGASIGGFELLQGADMFDDFITFSSLVAHKDGSVWMITGRGNKARLVHLKQADFSVYDGVVPNHLIASPDGGVFVSTAKGVSEIPSGNSELITLFAEPTGTMLYDKPSNALWYSPIGDNTNCLRKYSFDTKETNTFTIKNTPVDPTIFVMNQDAEGNKLFLSTNGLCLLDVADMSQHPAWDKYPGIYFENETRFKEGEGIINKNGVSPTRFNTYRHSNAVNSEVSRYLGIYENGAWTHLKVNVAKEAKTFLISGTMLSASCYTSKGILLGTTNNGLMVLDRTDGMAEYVPGYDSKAFGKEVRAIVEDNNGTVWIATQKGLIKYDGKEFVLLDKKNSDLQSNKINLLYVSPDNVLWIGTGDKGMISFDGTNWANYGKKEGLKNQNIHIMAGAGEKVYCSGVNFLRRSDVLQTIDNGAITSEKTPVVIGQHNMDTDNEGNLWLVSISGTVAKKPASGGNYVVYDAKNSPLNDNCSETKGYHFDGKFYLTANGSPLSSAASAGFSTEVVSPEKQAAINYEDRVATFMKDVLYVFEVVNK